MTNLNIKYLSGLLLSNKCALNYREIAVLEIEESRFYPAFANNQLIYLREKAGNICHLGVHQVLWSTRIGCGHTFQVERLS
jgi:hypothetical protein